MSLTFYFIIGLWTKSNRIRDCYSRTKLKGKGQV